MTGYNGGLSTKFLLTHEGVPVPERMQQLSVLIMTTYRVALIAERAA